MKFDTQPALCYFFLLPLPFKYQVLDLQYEDTIGALAELEALGHPWQVSIVSLRGSILIRHRSMSFSGKHLQKIYLVIFWSESIENVSG